MYYSASEYFFLAVNATPEAVMIATNAPATPTPVLGEIALFSSGSLVVFSADGNSVTDGLIAAKQLAENANVNINVANKANNLFFIIKPPIVYKTTLHFIIHY